MKRTTLVNAGDTLVGTEESERHEGSLKLFLSYASGSGTTAAMLDEAKGLMASGRDVYVAEFDQTGAATGQAFDVDVALKRNPDVVVLENLTHINHEGLRNKVRYQDAEELLRAGIDVFATLRVSDLRNEQDRVRSLGLEGPDEPVPDYLFYGAQQLEFVDIDPTELIARCRAGGRAVPEAHILGELRLMALRCLGEYAASSNLSHAPSHAQTAFRDRVIAVVETGVPPRDVLIAATRIAALSHAPLEAVCVRPPRRRDDGEDPDGSYAVLVEQVEAMGFSLETLYGEDPAESIRDYLRVQGATDVVVARHRLSRARRMLTPIQLPFEERIVDNTGDIQVHLVANNEPRDAGRILRAGMARLGDFGPGDIVAALAITALAATVARGMVSTGLGEGISYLIWMGSIFAVAVLTRSYLPCTITAIGTVLLQDYLFIRPYASFTIDHRASLATLAFAAVALVAFALVSCRIARASEVSRRRERHTQALFDLNRSLVYAHSVVEVVDISTDALARLFDRSVAFYVRDPMSRPSQIDTHAAHVRALPGDLGREDFERLPELAIAHWVFVNGEVAGDGTDTNGESYVYYMPLSKHDEVVGVIGVSAFRGFDMSDRSYLELVANQIVLAFERQTLLVDHVDDVRMTKAVDVRNDFVTGVLESSSRSADLVHDLSEIMSRTSIDPTYRDALARASAEETARSHLMVDRILSALGSGPVEPNCDVVAQVRTAADEVRGGLSGKSIVFEQVDTAPHVFADSALVRLAAKLVLEASTSYIAKNGCVEVAVRDEDGRVTVVFSDDRPEALGTVKPGALEIGAGAQSTGGFVYDTNRFFALRDVFRDPDLMTGNNQALLRAMAKSMRVPEDAVRDEASETALNRLRLLRFDRIEYGLYMAALIVHAHGGTIKQRYRLGGGSVISFTLPKER